MSLFVARSIALDNMASREREHGWNTAHWLHGMEKRLTQRLKVLRC